MSRIEIEKEIEKLKEEINIKNNILREEFYKKGDYPLHLMPSKSEIFYYPNDAYRVTKFPNRVLLEHLDTDFNVLKRVFLPWQCFSGAPDDECLSYILFQQPITWE